MSTGESASGESARVIQKIIHSRELCPLRVQTFGMRVVVDMRSFFGKQEASTERFDIASSP